MVQPVTDPAILAQLEGSSGEVTDPAILAMLNEQPEEPAYKNLAKLPKELLGFLEAPLSMGTGIVASALGGWRGILGGGAEGVQKTQEALTYQPRSGVGKAIVQGISAPFEMASEKLGEAGQFAFGDAGEAIGKSIIPVAGTLYGGVTTAAAAKSAATRRASAAASKQIENLQQATTQAKYQAAKDLMDMGGVVNPADVNTSSSVQLAGRFANAEKLREAAAERNSPVVVKAIKKELGIADDMPLDAKTLEAVRSKAAEANEAIRAIGSLTDDGNFVNSLNSILPNRNVIGQSVGAKKIANLIDETTGKVSSGMTGADALESIRTLRADSRATFNRTDLKPKDRRVAEAQRKVADALEGLIEKNLADPALIGKYRSGRELQAKTYVVEDILTPSGAVNLQNLLKGAPSKAKLTGELAKLKNIAAQFPSTTGIISPEIASAPTTLYRTGPGGTAGAAIGAPLGAPVSGGIAGTLAELVGAGLKRKQMLSPKYQAKNVLPEVTELVSPIPGAVPPVPTSNLPIPYVSRGTVNPPEGPNWVPGRGFGPDITPQMPPTAGMLGFTPSENLGVGRGGASFGGAEQNINLRRRTADIAARQAEAEAAAAEASAPRQPASGGMLFDLDPITGKLRPVDQGLKGATPSTISSTGNALKSAVDKMSSGRRFAMDADELIAWNKRKVDLVDAVPQLKGLSDEAIASRMSDRQWVASRIKELETEYADWAKETAAKFNAERAAQTSARANEPRIMSGTERKWDKLTKREASRRMEMQQRIRALKDVEAELMGLEEGLLTPRAGTQPFVGQGPKTRAANRGMLFGENQ